jgi:hypothetical protein
MLHTLVLAAATATSPFLDDFAGVWTCGNASYRERWEITPAGDGRQQWAGVVYGDPASPDGHAVVGLLVHERVWIYDDFHTDGSYAHLYAQPPKDHVWVWTGSYYPLDAARDDAPIITWTLTPQGTIERTFAKRSAEGGAIAMGGDTCKKVSTP